MSDTELIEQARNYCEALGINPGLIQNAGQARQVLERLAENCKKWGSD